MLKRLFILLLLTAAPCLGQTPAIIQSGGGSNSSTSTFGANVVSGHTIIIVGTWQSATGTPTVSDTLSTSYSQLYFNTSHTDIVCVYIGTLTSSGADTITVSEAGANRQVTQLEEMNMGSISQTLDGTPVLTTFSGNAQPFTSGNLTTSINGDWLLSLGFQEDNSNLICNPSENAINGGSWFGVQRQYLCERNAGTNGTYSTTWQFPGTTGTGYLVLMAFKPTAIAITSPATLPDGIQGDPYSYTLGAVGGAGAYTWTITSGQLPLGLSLNSSTGAITGTPTNSNANTITFKVSDGSVNASKGCTLHVGASAATITHVQDTDGSGNFASNVTAGNLLVVPRIRSFGVVPPTDTLGTVFAYIGSVATNGTVSGGEAEAMIFVGTAPSTGADTITNGNCCAVGIVSSEFSNAQNYADIFISNVGRTNTTSMISSAITPPASNSLLYGVAPNNQNAGGFSSSTCTVNGGNNIAGASCFVLSTTITGYTETITTGSTIDGWGWLLFAFRPKSSGIAPLPSGNHPKVISF